MDRPNIICVSVDSLRSDFCSFSENPGENTTPFLQSLIDEATLFTNTISPSIWTLPVHTSIFSGLFPPEHGVLTGSDVLSESHPTFAEILSESGYSTNAFYTNAWLDTADILRGFDKKNTEDVSDSETQGFSIKHKIAHAAGLLSPKIKYFLTRSYRGQKQYREWRGHDPIDGTKGTGGEKTISAAIRETGVQNAPFCWFVHLNDAHHLYTPPNPYHRLFTNRNTAALTYNVEWWQKRLYYSRSKRLKATAGDITPPAYEVDTFKNLYRGAIRYCDSLIERLTDELKQVGEWENTILIVFGDHGDGFGEDGVYGHHFSLHESVTSVPLLIRDPTGQIPPETVPSPTSLVDIYATVLGLTGIDGPETNSVDLTEESREYAYSYYDISGHDYYTDAASYGVEQDRLPPAKQYGIWGPNGEKVISYPDRGDYVMSQDADEALRKQLDAHTQQLELIESEDRELTDSVERRLVEMGYLRE
ncbi:sulfatase [Halostella salina]|uniref:sulfatase n=1 Tax=Halostella salina TaxID=1547897 RepID=UPI0013CE5FC9|nr:sulfatase [Halostella salina]